MNTVSVNVRELLGLVVVGYIAALFAIPAAFLGFVGAGSLLTFLTTVVCSPQYLSLQ